jgi:uncharacterized protein (TIGR03083 family)
MVVQLAITKSEIVRGTRTERGRTLGLLRSLEPAQWDIEVLPGWRVREVAAHLITIDKASVTGSIFPKILTSSDKLERWNDKVVGGYADRSVPELLLALDQWGTRLLRVVKATPAKAFGVRVPTMWGKGPAGMFAWSRPFDEWVHRQDVRLGLGMSLETADVAVPAGFVLAAAGTSVVPEMHGRTGSITIDLSGVPIHQWTADLSTGESWFRPPGDKVARHVTVTAPASRFVMAATGRGTFAELEDEGVLTIDGDREIGDEFLRLLRVV